MLTEMVFYHHNLIFQYYWGYVDRQLEQSEGQPLKTKLP